MLGPELKFVTECSMNDMGTGEEPETISSMPTSSYSTEQVEEDIQLYITNILERSPADFLKSMEAILRFETKLSDNGVLKKPELEIYYSLSQNKDDALRNIMRCPSVTEKVKRDLTSSLPNASQRQKYRNIIEEDIV